MENITIRKALIEDKEKVNDAHVRSIREVCSKDYTPFQIEKWSGVVYSDDIWKNTVEVDCCYVVEMDGVIEGVCHSRVHENNTGEIVGLYFSPKIAGKGLGRKVFEMGMDHIRKHDVSKVVISGTKTAKGFYEAMGFNVVEEKLFNIRGADIECFNMEMNLS